MHSLLGSCNSDIIADVVTYVTLLYLFGHLRSADMIENINMIVKSFDFAFTLMVL